MDKGSGYRWTSRLVLPGACVAPTSCLFLHLVVPGGYIGSHSLVVGVTTALLCFVHVLLACKERVRCDQLVILIISFVLGTVTFHITAVLFGAHLLRHFQETLLWASLMSSLTVLPPASLLRNSWTSWTRVFILHRFDSSAEQTVFLVSMGTVVGAWLGALPIPLDWNRPWQVWPITCTSGAISGNIISSFITVCLLTIRTDSSSKYV